VILTPRVHYLVQRVLFSLGTVFVAITLNFFLFRILPGDAVRNMSRVPHASPELKDALRQQFGLDSSPWEQYLRYLNQLAHGNMGVSFSNQQPVWDNLVDELGNTLPMVVTGTLGAVLLGTASGVMSAWWRDTWRDRLNTNVAILWYAVPTQWLALVLVIYLSAWFPTHGMSNDFLIDPTWWDRQIDMVHHMILPSLTLMLTLYGSYTLIVRSAMLETLGEDYVLTARAKGLTPRVIVVRHALRNALLPVTTLVALSLGYLVAGAILIETVFSWPGIGYAVYQAVVGRDYPTLQGAFLVLTCSVVFFNLVADLIYFKLDPRVVG
jgi:ABC-type dipeptide/oligopeptide/nickel transport system permease component